MYGKIYRHAFLPLHDTVKNRNTVKYWEKAEKTQWETRDTIEKTQLDNLSRLLSYASLHSPYYKKKWTDHGINISNISSLIQFQEIPLTTRSDISNNRILMRSTEPLTLIAKSTGGSSGEPLHFDISHDSNDRRIAMSYRGYNWAGAPPGSKQFYIWGTSMDSLPNWKKLKIALHERMSNRLVISCFDFVPEHMRDHLAHLKRYKPDVIIAYTNAIYEFARFLQQESLSPFQPKSIIVGAEPLHDFQRNLIETVFQAPVFETYGSREFMLIGAECEKHCGLHLSMENLLLEVINDDGSPTPVGEEGNVVITDLFNYGMPFIRYVNGDRAIAGFEACPCGRGLPLLRKVTGRQVDTLEAPDGRKIPGMFFPHLFKEFPSVKRFQVIQNNREEIIIKAVTGGQLTPDDRKHLLLEIALVTGPSVKITLEEVDDIPLTKMGKLKVVIRNY